MGIVLSKNANKSVTATMATNYEISGAAEAANNTAVADAPIIEAEDWQTKCLTVLDRNKFIFSRELLSDVKFVVPASNGKRLVIPAHKFILAISSPVFCAMFYGPMAETKNSIDLPDYEYESLLELLRFLYYDKVNLSGSNVMQVLNLATQYMVPSLVNKCTKYLRDILEVSNVFQILVAAEKFEAKELERECWKLIEMQADEALMSDGFSTVEISVVKSVVKRRTLNVKEVDLFKAIDQWATKKIVKQGQTLTGHLKRRILGDEIVKAIRFPLISQAEFASVVLSSGILTNEENSDMMRYYSNVPTISLPFSQEKRFIASFFRCHRFSGFDMPIIQTRKVKLYDNSHYLTRNQLRSGQLARSYRQANASSAVNYSASNSSKWCYDVDSTDKLKFSVNKPIRLRGVELFGSIGNEYQVSLQVNCTEPFTKCLVTQSGNYASTARENSKYYGFDVLFDRPIHLEAYKYYELLSIIKGPLSWYGQRGQSSVECQGVLFTFKDPYDSRHRTNASCGQFPSLIFT